MPVRRADRGHLVRGRRRPSRPARFSWRGPLRRCAGPPCGKALSTETTSTIGEQRRTNYALQDLTEDAFVAAVTEGQPAHPRYFAFDARANQDRHALLDEHAPDLLDLADVLARRA